MFELIYINAMLSDAFYVPLREEFVDESTGKLTDFARDDFMEQRGWTLKQFEWFQRNFKVYLNSAGELAYQDNTSSGFAAANIGHPQTF